GALLDVSGAPGGGGAGDIELVAGGLLTFDADVRAAVAAGEVGGGFSLDAAEVSDLGTLNARLETAGFDRSRRYRVRQGDLALLAGETLTAHQVLLQADTGTVTVGGTIQASGSASSPGGGRVQLVAGNGLALLDGALIDAHAAATPADAFPAASGQVE